MSIISVFNNKGGVGKTTLLYHLGYALAVKGKKVLFLDLDPQSNLTFNAIPPDCVAKIWEEEDDYIADFKSAKENNNSSFQKIISEPRSIHFILKPIEDGLDMDMDIKPFNITNNLDIIPGRLSLQMFERTVSTNWSNAFIGAPAAIRIISSIRAIANKYTSKYGYDYVLIDTSPSLGDLNRVTVALSDYFFIPCTPDIFSIYGIRNIGATLKVWGKEFKTLFTLLPEIHRKAFPIEIVRVIGYTIYKAQKRTDAKNELQIPLAHYNHAKSIPSEIKKYIPEEFICKGSDMEHSIGGNAIIYSDNTYPAMSQKYNLPMWALPDSQELAPEDRGTIISNRDSYRGTLSKYTQFAEDIISRTVK